METNGHDHNVKNIGWAILLNIGITVAEAIGGTLSGSLALLSDAGHNLSDVISLGLSFLGEKLSEKKATRRHTFGFKRTEIFTALINSLSLVGIAFFIVGGPLTGLLTVYKGSRAEFCAILAEPFPIAGGDAVEGLPDGPQAAIFVVFDVFF